MLSIAIIKNTQGIRNDYVLYLFGGGKNDDKNRKGVKICLAVNHTDAKKLKKMRGKRKLSRTDRHSCLVTICTKEKKKRKKNDGSPFA